MPIFSHNPQSESRKSITLSASTLRVYIYILENFNDRVSVKSIQEGLNFSSSSTAHFHLRKLVEYGLLEEDRGIYYIRKSKKVDFITNFVRIRNKLIPKDLFYFTIVLCASLSGMYYFHLKHFTLLDMSVFLTPSVIAILFFIKNTIDLLSMKKRILKGVTKAE